MARELLTESGSIFVQINDENLHLVRCLLDEVFGRENFVAVVAFKKTGGFPSGLLASIYEYLLWYARDKSQTRYRQLHLLKTETGTAEQYGYVDDNGRAFEPTSLFSEGATASGSSDFTYQGRIFRTPPNSHWKSSLEGIERLGTAERLWLSRNTLRYVRYLDDFPVAPLTNVWDDTMGEREMLYAVQTNTKVVERCILMTTDPGDLVFDPTCGSGTTAYCAEK
ncbi:MAG: site-specific DNA-methyltransferase [Bacteroidota bacterium]|nr:site-specific DNA-methyltransferase [Bacteroidota bacterium]